MVIDEYYKKKGIVGITNYYCPKCKKEFEHFVYENRPDLYPRYCGKCGYKYDFIHRLLHRRLLYYIHKLGKLNRLW